MARACSIKINFDDVGMGWTYGLTSTNSEYSLAYERLLPRSVEPATCPWPEPDWSNPRAPKQFC